MGASALIKKCMCALISCLIIQPWFLASPASALDESLSPDAIQTAEMLGIRSEIEQVFELRRRGGSIHLLNKSRGIVLRKIFHAAVQFQSAENRLESEMAYTYDVMSREQRRTNTVNQFFNIFNFLQFGILYTIEPYSRIHKQFTQSAVCTTVGAGLGIGLPLMCIFYNKMAKASHLAPPAFLAVVINGKPVDGSNLPPLLIRYLDLTAAGSTQTRREELNAIWKQRYHSDMAKKETLCGIDDGKSKNPFLLNSRIVLLWSLYTYIQRFNRDLLSLLNQVRGSQFSELSSDSRTSTPSTGLSGGAAQATRLLQLDPIIEELNSGGGGDSDRKDELRLTLLETLLAGYIDVQIAVGKCQEELNYQYDVVLSSMTTRRGKFLQKTYEANFIQTGTFGACAGWCYLNHYPKAGNELFILADAIGLGITTVSSLALHGGWRKNQSEPNSLADFFDLRANGRNGFSPLVWNFLNSPSLKRTDGKTRRQIMQEEWSQSAVANVNLKNPHMLDKLGSMPSCKWDTIKVVVNRIALLGSLREHLGHFDAELLELLQKAWPDSNDAGVQELSGLNLTGNVSADGAAKLLGIQTIVARIKNDPSDHSSKLQATRNIMQGFLDASSCSDILGRQIVKESQVMNRMLRQRDMVIQLTNIINFYQIGALGCVADSLGLSSNDQYVLVGNRINIISGLMVSCLAITALLERHGGVRPTKAEPNSLFSVFGKKAEYMDMSPLMVKYLNTAAPVMNTTVTRREYLVRYWKETKVLSVNVSRDSNIEKLSAQGKAHHWWSETIRLIHNRITMLYDLRATLRTSNVGFSELLDAID